MPEVTLDKVLESVMQLPEEQQEMLVEIIKHRHIEARRQEIAQGARESLALFRGGKLRPQTADEVIQELRRLDVGTHEEVY